jgi:hypothetical protein
MEPELPVEDQEPLSNIAMDIVWMIYEAQVVHGRDPAPLWAIVFEELDRSEDGAID